MQAKNSNELELRNSGVEAFLYSDIGEETNGSMLTILSMLARLGPAPWAQAMGWAALPKSEVVEVLARKIGQMPLEPSAQAEAHATATRLVELLPTARPAARLNGLVKTEGSTALKRLPITLLYGAMAVGMAFIGQLAIKSSQAVNPATEPLVTISGASAVPPINAGSVSGVTTAPLGSLQRGSANQSCQPPRALGAQALCGDLIVHKPPATPSR